MTAFSSVQLGIVCPMGNEANNAQAFTKEVLEVCSCHGFRSICFFPILDRVSQDGTLDLMRQMQDTDQRIRVVYAPENRCVVDAYLQGYREALNGACDWILEIDAGYSHSPQDIPKFFQSMASGKEAVFGTRFSNGGSFRDAPLQRKGISFGGTLLTNLLLGTRLSDMTSGFELFHRTVLHNILERGIHSRGPFFQTEIRVLAHDYPIGEVGIHYRSPSHAIKTSLIQDAFLQLFRLFRQRLQGRLWTRHRQAISAL